MTPSTVAICNFSSPRTVMASEAGPIKPEPATSTGALAIICGALISESMALLSRPSQRMSARLSPSKSSTTAGRFCCGASGHRNSLWSDQPERTQGPVVHADFATEPPPN